MRPFYFFKQAVEDIRANLVLHVLAVSTISLIFLLAGAFALVFVNVSGIMESSTDNVRIMVYLDYGLTDSQAREAGAAIKKASGVREIVFVSREQAFKRLKESMEHQSGLLEGLSKNPLPDAYEVFLDPGGEGWERIESAARRIEKIQGVDEANYGQAWLERFAVIAGMARVVALALGALLLVAALSITANTIRLVLHNRREEIRIMELVGATNSFIRASFYVQGMLQGFFGGAIALGLLSIIFFVFVTGLPTQELLGRFEPRFIPAWSCVLGVSASVLLGVAGCHISFAQFQKD